MTRVRGALYLNDPARPKDFEELVQNLPEEYLTTASGDEFLLFKGK